jgi:glutathione S-transferase
LYQSCFIIGRHTKETIHQFQNEDIKAISTLLGDKEYIFGSQPSYLDAVLFGFLVAYASVGTPLSKFTEKECPNLVPYVERIVKKYWQPKQK